MSARPFPIEALPLEVFEHVLSFMTVFEVLRCCLVSRRWRDVCRSYMKIYRQSIARIRYSMDELFDLNYVFLRDELSFVNGLHVGHVPLSSSDVNVDTSCSVIRNLGLKYISIGMYLGQVHSVKYRLLQSLVLANRRTLKKIIVQGPWCRNFYQLLQFLRGPNDDGVYLAVREVEFEDAVYSFRNSWNALQAIVLPNLKQLNGKVVLTGVDYFNVSFIDCIRNVRLPSNDPSLLNRMDIVTNFCNLVNRLNSLQFDCYDMMPGVVSRMFDCYYDLVVRNCSSLKTLSICRCQLVKLRYYDYQLRFRSVTDLSISPYSQVLDNVSALDNMLFNVMFCSLYVSPSLKRVSFCMSLFRNNDRNVLNTDPVKVPSEHKFSVTIHNYNDCLDDISSLGYVALRIESLKVHIVDLLVEPIFCSSSIFLVCSNLTRLSLKLSNQNFVVGQSEYDYDALLCGVFIEEAMRLRQMYWTGEIDITAMNIVPIRPSLIHATRLQNLVIEDFDVNHPRVHRISPVSCHLVFERMKHMKVVVRVNEMTEGYYRQMRKYVHLEAM